MLQVPAERFGLSAEPVLLVRNGRVLYANNAACRLFSADCTGAPVSGVLGAGLAGIQSCPCIQEAELGGQRYLVRVQSAEGLRLYLFRAAENAPEQINEAFRYALRACLMDLGVGSSLLRDRLEGVENPALSAPLAQLDRALYRLNRMVANQSIVQDAATGKLRCHPVSLELCGFLRDLANSVSALVPTPELRLRLPEALNVRADPTQLELVVLNLLSNAFLHAEGCGRISLSLHAAGEQVILSVDDDGCGISPEGLQSVFDRYRHGFNLSAMARGTGFGLSAVREIARLHGGTLLLESREGGGTAVRVSLSRTRKSSVTAQEGESAYVRSYSSILTGLADCLPASAFSGLYQ